MAGLAGAGMMSLAAAAEDACRVQSGAAPLPVIELYTSEGCNSCPPADQWSSTLKGRRDLVALAFHVDYWDRLGWKDRFASPAYSERQERMVAAGAARFAYTPQVLLNGLDWRGWPSGLPAAGGAAAPVRIELQRHGDTVDAIVQPAAAPSGTRPEAATGASGPKAGAEPGGPWVSGYWAVTEDSHRSEVKAGENAGATLLHDNVVRRYLPVEPWRAAGVQTLHLDEPALVDGHARRVVFVVQDPRSLRPLQAAALGC